MRIRRWGIAGIVALSLLTPGLAACGGDDAGSTDTTAEAGIPADPKQALLGSTEDIGKGNFRFTMKADSIAGDGFVHLASRSAQMTMKAGESGEFSLDMDLIYIEPETWVKIDISGMEGLPGGEKLNSGKYQHLDQSKIKDIEDLQFDFNDVDPAGSALLTKAIVDVRKTAEGAYSGTLDLSKATDAGLADEETVKALGAEAAKLPFTAKLDAQGRLTEFTISIPAVAETKAHELQVTYEYDTAAAAKKPAANQVVEASDETYEMFKG